MIATRNSSTRNLIETIANELEQADKVLIGAGACSPMRPVRGPPRTRRRLLRCRTR